MCLGKPLEPQFFYLHDGFLGSCQVLERRRRGSHHKHLETHGPCQEPQTEMAPEKSLSGVQKVLEGFLGMKDP